MYPSALIEMYSEITVAFRSSNTIPILHPKDQGVILTFKSYYLRNIFYKAIAARDHDSSNGFRQSKLKTLWKEIAIQGVTKNIAN